MQWNPCVGADGGGEVLFGLGFGNGEGGKDTFLLEMWTD